MAPSASDSSFQFEISLSVLNHLGRNLYRNFITVLGEAISNSWDADAKNVWITTDRENSSFTIKDDGCGMTAEDFQTKFLTIGYSKRKTGTFKTADGRPFIGSKGIGKLALLSCAQQVSIFSKTTKTEYTGGTIDNTGLDDAIKNDVLPDQYPLGQLDLSLIEGLTDGHEKGTILVFQNSKEHLRNSVAHLKKLLAMSFRFSLLDPDFNIFVDREIVSNKDLKDLMSATEFLWIINGYSDDYVKGLGQLKADVTPITTPLELSGFFGTVTKPRDLKISRTDERATVDLFVNGRLREKNIIRHIPTQRIVESYLYGQVHFDFMDSTGNDPFTSSREGIVEGDPNFLALMKFLKGEVIPKVLEDWDVLRLARGKEGDDENARVSKRKRKALDLYTAATEEYRPEESGEARDQVDLWMDELRPDAQFNVDAYVDCFLSENLVRKYLKHHSIISDEAKKEPMITPSRNSIEKQRQTSVLTSGKIMIRLVISEWINWPSTRKVGSLKGKHSHCGMMPSASDP